MRKNPQGTKDIKNTGSELLMEDASDLEEEILSFYVYKRTDTHWWVVKLPLSSSLCVALLTAELDRTTQLAECTVANAD